MFLFRKIRTIKRKMMHSPQSNGVVAADRRMIKMPKVGHTTSDGVSLKSLNDSTNSDGFIEVPEQDCEVPCPRSPDSMSLENSMREDHEMETSTTSTQDSVIAGKKNLKSNTCRSKRFTNRNLPFRSNGSGRVSIWSNNLAFNLRKMLSSGIQQP